MSTEKSFSAANPLTKAKEWLEKYTSFIDDIRSDLRAAIETGMFPVKSLGIKEHDLENLPGSEVLFFMEKIQEMFNGSKKPEVEIAVPAPAKEQKGQAVSSKHGKSPLKRLILFGSGATFPLESATGLRDVIEKYYGLHGVLDAKRLQGHLLLLFEEDQAMKDAIDSILSKAVHEVAKGGRITGLPAPDLKIHAERVHRARVFNRTFRVLADRKDSIQEGQGHFMVFGKLMDVVSGLKTVWKPWKWLLKKCNFPKLPASTKGDWRRETQAELGCCSAAAAAAVAMPMEALTKGVWRGEPVSPVNGQRGCRRGDRTRGEPRSFPQPIREEEKGREAKPQPMVRGSLDIKRPVDAVSEVQSRQGGEVIPSAADGAEPGLGAKSFNLKELGVDEGCDSVFEAICATLEHCGSNSEVTQAMVGTCCAMRSFFKVCLDRLQAALDGALLRMASTTG